MRLIPLVPAMLILLMSGPLAAEDWIEYSSRTDLFTVNFPGQPKVRDIAYPTEFGATVPARVHGVDNGANHFSVTVVDYSNVQQIQADRVKGCTLYANVCANPYIAELRGALDFAAWGFLKRDAKVTYYGYGNTDRIEGRRLQLTNADRSQTYVMIHMHENRLYILDGTVPAGAAPPALFQQSLGFLDKNGVRVRYDTIYGNMYPAPTRVQY